VKRPCVSTASGSESSSSWKLDGVKPAARREGEVLRVVRLRVLDDDETSALSGS